MDIDNPVRYDGYEAIYFSGPSKRDGETKLGLAFGDENFVMMLVGLCQTFDKTAMDKLNKIFATSNNKKTILYQVIIHKGTTAVLFLSSDGEQGKWL